MTGIGYAQRLEFSKGLAAMQRGRGEHRAPWPNGARHSNQTACIAANPFNILLNFHQKKYKQTKKVGKTRYVLDLRH